MIYRNENGNICEIKKTDFPNDALYYKKIYETMVKIDKYWKDWKDCKIAKREESVPSTLKKAFQYKEKKQSNKKNENVAASEVHV